MTTKHTPGPWEWDGTVWDYDEAQHAPWLVQSGSDGRNHVLRGSIQANTEEDARLIAAAPTMYAYIEQRAAEGDEDARTILGVIHANA